VRAVGEHRPLQRLSIRRVVEPCRPPGPLPLLLHGALEPLEVGLEAALAGQQGGQVGRESVGVVEEEDLVPRDPPGARVPFRRLLEAGQALGEGGAEALLFELQRHPHRRRRVAELGVGVPHHLHDEARQLGQEGTVEAEPVPLHRRAPQDPPDHVAATLVAREDPLGEREGEAADVVGDDVHGRTVRPLVGPPAHLLDQRDQRTEGARLEERPLPLEDHGDPLQAEPGVDPAVLERREPPVGLHVVLREDHVADLDPPVAVASRAALRAVAADVRPEVVVDLGVRAARAGVTRRPPEVVLLAEAVDPLARHPDLPLPDRERLVVLLVDGDLELLRRQPQQPREELPVPGDRLALEVVAEGEVAEHLEEGEVAKRLADLFDVGGAEAGLG